MKRYLTSFIHTCILAGFVVSTPVCRAQTGPVGPEPLAGKLSGYTEVPVDLYTGVPDISLPFFLVQSSEWDIPVRLAYHPSGLRPGADAGDCGLGWTLHAAGVLTRSLHGLPDERPGRGYLFAESLIPSEDSVFNESAWPYALKRLAASGMMDLEPDVFNVSAPGLSCRIVFDHDDVTGLMRAYTIPHSDAIITEYYDSKGLSGWKILDGNGITYYFGKDDQGREATDITALSSSTGNPSLYTSAWHLLKMVAPGHTDSVIFSYDSTQVTNNRLLSQSKVFPLGNCTGWETEEEYNTATIGHRLINMVFRQGSIGFVRITPRLDVGFTDYELDSVIIRDAEGRILRSFALYQHYIQSAGCQAQEMFNCRRLLLDSVRVFGNDGSSIPAWKFLYYPGSLPSKTSKAIDHWGFYNGADQNNTLIPSFQSGPVNFSGADREPHPQYLLRQALWRMVLPFGGFTEYTWEAHDYGAVTSASAPGFSSSPASAFLSGNHQANGPWADTLETRFYLTHGQNIDLLHQWNDMQGLSIESEAQIVDMQGVISYTIAPSHPQQPFFLAGGEYTLRLILAVQEGGQLSLSWSNYNLDSNSVTQSGSMTAGGLRIGAIRHFDGQEWTGQRTYSYTLVNGGSSGVLLSGTPVYMRVFREPVIMWTGSGSAPLPVITGHCSYLGLSGADQAGRSAFGEAHIAYSRILVGFGVQDGSGTRAYSYMSSPAERSAFYPYPPSGANFYRRGDLLSVKEAGADGLLRGEVSYHYSDAFGCPESSYHVIRGVRIAWDEKSIGPAFDSFVIAPYEYKVSRLKTDSVIRKLYPDNGNQPLVSSTVYRYSHEADTEPAGIMKSYPDGNRLLSLFIRNRDLLDPAVSPGNSFGPRRRDAMSGVLDDIGASGFNEAKSFIIPHDVDVADSIIVEASAQLIPLLDSLEAGDSLLQKSRMSAVRSSISGSAAEAAALFAAQNRQGALWGSIDLHCTDTADFIESAGYTEFSVNGDEIIRPASVWTIPDTGNVFPASAGLLSLESSGALESALPGHCMMNLIGYDQQGRLSGSRRKGGPETRMYYRQSSEFPCLITTGLDSIVDHTDFSRPITGWQGGGGITNIPEGPDGKGYQNNQIPLTYTGLAAGEYRLIFLCYPGNSTCNLLFDNSLLDIDTIGSRASGWYWMSARISSTSGGSLQFTGNILLDEIFLMPAAMNYVYEDRDMEGRVVLRFGTGEPFLTYDYDCLGRYQRTRDARGVERHAREYLLSGNPVY